MSFLTILGGLLKLFNGLFSWFQRREAQSEGAAMQRDVDMRAENERIAKASRAADDVDAGGGVPVETDKFNRDTRK